MKLWNLAHKHFWDMYSDMLVNGYCEISPVGEPLRLNRTGPFLPGMTFISNYVLVSSHVRSDLEASGLGDFEFRPVVLNHIIEHDWHLYDRTLEEPPEYPPEDEIESYIDARPHSEAARIALGEVWQVLPRLCGTWEFSRDWEHGLRPLAACRDDGVNDHFFRARKKINPNPACCIHLVDDIGRDWLASHVGEWVDFIECVEFVE